MIAQTQLSPVSGRMTPRGQDSLAFHSQGAARAASPVFHAPERRLHRRLGKPFRGSVTTSNVNPIGEPVAALAVTPLERTRGADRRDRAGWRERADARLEARRRRPAGAPVRRD